VLCAVLGVRTAAAGLAYILTVSFGPALTGTDARRFYERHGYLNSEPGQDQTLLYYYRGLTDAS